MNKFIGGTPKTKKMSLKKMIESQTTRSQTKAPSTPLFELSSAFLLSNTIPTLSARHKSKSNSNSRNAEAKQAFNVNNIPSPSTASNSSAKKLKKPIKISLKPKLKKTKKT